MSFNLVKAIFINRAPFEHLVLDFKEKGINVLSAINGNGKTTILSHITDAFYELAKKVFHNEFEGRENKYYRVSSSLYNINLASPSFVYLRFECNGEYIDYIDIRNKCTEEQYNSVITIDSKIEFAQIRNKLSNSNNIKYWSLNDEKKINDIFSNSVLTYFPSYRYETPSYLNDPYTIKLDYAIKSKFEGYLENQIEVVSDLPTLANWFLDVLLDMKLKEETRLIRNGNNLLPITIPSAEKKCVWDNLNRIVSSALSSKHYEGIIRLGIGTRNSGSTRIAIMNDVPQKTSKCICPSIFNLSAGELSLISIFGEILRQADNNHNNIQLNDINGIVLIDEVDKHLHITLQKEILPKLFELFPNIQFIVSSHSPFLNMGLADTLVERSQIIDLDNNGITCSPANNDLYKEVYDLMVGENNQFAKKYYQLENTLKAIKKPLVITEGKTDIKFIQKAKDALGLNDVIFDVITPDQQPDGDSNLQKMLEQLCKIKRPFPIIGIFDRDVDGIVKKVDIGDNKYKNYGNKVYAFCIPIPKIREDRGQTKISIEYLFSDKEIKSSVDEVGHRLFFGTEFTRHSMVHNECINLTLSKPDGKGIDKILENNGGQAVYDENDNNILAKKDDFANAVVSGHLKISDESWENFRPILEKIKKLSEL